jgi:hypothetical protein
VTTAEESQRARPTIHGQPHELDIESDTPLR